MFWLITLLSFRGYLPPRCVSLNNGPCMNLIDLNLVEFSYYSLMVSLDKFSESCNTADDLSTKI